ncbi:MAG: peptidylprolyl isomerase [Sulfuricurvum sp.]|nr:peptidylprolyl isomerase [Sulfuricurvum sp.]
MIIAKNCIVTLKYRVTDTDEELIDPGSDPIIYIHGGYESIFTPIEEALEGKSIGDSFKVALSAHEAFGDYNDDLLIRESLDNLPENLEVGMQMEGNDILYMVTEIQEDHAILDGNHPFAGLNLIFEGSVNDIRPATEEEIKNAAI